jgi:hypothetical protein
MALNDVLAGNAFGLTSLTKSINRLPVQQGRLGRMGIFRGQGITTKTVNIEWNHGRLGLVKTAARGTMPNVIGGDKRKVRSFAVPHIPLNSSIMADDVTDVRAFGDEDSTETVAQLVNARLEKMKNYLEATKEFHRAGALQGVVLDGDGTTEIFDYFDEFGITENEVEFDFATDDAKAKCLEVIRIIEDALGSTPYREVYALAGDEFFDGFIAQEDVREAYRIAGNAAFFSEQQANVGGNETGFKFGGITWFNYRTKIGSTFYVPTDVARFFPVGTDIFEEYWAPAEFNETVNTIGKPYYAKQIENKWGTGYELHAQCNPLYLPTNPSVLVKGVNVTES